MAANPQAHKVIANWWFWSQVACGKVREFGSPEGLVVVSLFMR